MESLQVAPVTFKITKFSQWLKSKITWYSSPFYAFNEGYQMCLRVCATNYHKDTHVSVYLYLLKGPHDDKLERSGYWPLRGTFTIELLNQLNDSDHYSHQVIYNARTDDKGTNRVLEGNIAGTGWGHQKFISHDTLFSRSRHVIFLIDDTLNFRISWENYKSLARV